MAKILYENNHYVFLLKLNNRLSKDLCWPSKYYWDQEKMGLCHRIDKNTTGINIIAKTNVGLYWLLSAFKNHKVRKTYIGIVIGNNLKIGPMFDRVSWNHNTQKAYIDKVNGRRCVAYTRFVYKINNKLSFVCIQIITGRRHQIRIQLAARNIFILGDVKYNKSSSFFPNHMFLHSMAYCFDQPEKERVGYSTHIPKIWHKLISCGLFDNWH